MPSCPRVDPSPHIIVGVGSRKVRVRGQGLCAKCKVALTVNDTALKVLECKLRSPSAVTVKTMSVSRLLAGGMIKATVSCGKTSQPPVVVGRVGRWVCDLALVVPL